MRTFIKQTKILLIMVENSHYYRTKMNASNNPFPTKTLNPNRISFFTLLQTSLIQLNSWDPSQKCLDNLHKYVGKFLSSNQRFNGIVPRRKNSIISGESRITWNGRFGTYLRIYGRFYCGYIFIFGCTTMIAATSRRVYDQGIQ